jgi:hypothetical protein
MGAGPGGGLAVLTDSEGGQGVETVIVSGVDRGPVPEVVGEKGPPGGDLLQDLGKIVGAL